MQPGNLPTLAFLAKSLGDENRLRILLSLENGKKSVSAIVEEYQGEGRVERTFGNEYS